MAIAVTKNPNPTAILLMASLQVLTNGCNHIAKLGLELLY
jgi:hypothetical protein